MIGKIYLIRNLVNGKGYVGQTVQSVYFRFGQHKYSAKRGSKTALHKAMRKYGFENFEVKTVASSDTLLLDDLEKHYIKFFGTYAPKGHGYNLTEGGDGSLEGRVFSKEGKENLSSVHKGNSYAKGHKVSAESRAKMSEAHKGKSNPTPEAVKKKISQTLMGHLVSEETRAKLSKASKGKPSPLRGKKGKPQSAEVKARISASMKELRAKQRAEREKV